MDNKEHEILPAPQSQPEKQPRQESVETPSALSSSRESENTASKAMENPAYGAVSPGAPASTSGSGEDQTSVSPQAPPPASSAATAQPAQIDAPQIADDVDLIEKEWVDKAKEIVEKTKADPFNQNREIIRLRADYMKKRYNKNIKLIKD